MRLPSLKLLAVAVLALGTVGLVANQVVASVPVIKGKGGKVFQVVNFTASPTGANFNTDVVTVPLKETMVVTDVIFTNDGTEAGGASLRCVLQGQNPVTILSPVIVNPQSNFSHSFGQGIECGENTKLQVSIAGPPNVNNWHVTVSGYLRKGL
jgi:hypothetical protein